MLGESADASKENWLQIDSLLGLVFSQYLTMKSSSLLWYDKRSAGQQALTQTPVGEGGDDPAETGYIQHTHHLQIRSLPRKKGVREEILIG